MYKLQKTCKFLTRNFKIRQQRTETGKISQMLTIPKMILEKYSDSPTDCKALPVPDMVTYNLRLKRVAKRCDIDKKTVSKMLGHISIKMTQIYAKVINTQSYYLMRNWVLFGFLLNALLFNNYPFSAFVCTFAADNSFIF
jgi:hypothetical protein